MKIRPKTLVYLSLATVAFFATLIIWQPEFMSRELFSGRMPPWASIILLLGALSASVWLFWLDIRTFFFPRGDKSLLPTKSAPKKPD
jgi:hypothetical protein